MRASCKILRAALWAPVNRSLPLAANTPLGAFVDLLSRASGIPVRALWDGVDVREPNLRLPDGRWTGMVGMVQRGEVDLVAGAFFVTEERARDVDFLYPRADAFSFAAGHPEAIQAGALVVLRPFTANFWFALTAIALVVTVCFWFVAKGKDAAFRKAVQRSDAIRRFPPHCYSPGSTFLYVLAPLLSQGISKRRFSSQHLLLTWLLGTSLLGHCYRSVLLSFLTFPSTRGVRDLPELALAVREGRYRCAALVGSSLGHVLVSSGREAERTIGRHLLEEGLYVNDNLLYRQTTSGGRRIALLALRSDLEYLSPTFFVSEDSFKMFLVGHIVYRKFLCKADLERAARRLSESGLVRKPILDHRFLEALPFLAGTRAEGQSSREVLALSEVLGVFAVLLAGHATACVSLLVEVLWKKTEKMRIEFLRRQQD